MMLSLQSLRKYFYEFSETEKEKTPEETPEKIPEKTPKKKSIHIESTRTK